MSYSRIRNIIRSFCKYNWNILLLNKYYQIYYIIGRTLTFPNLSRNDSNHRLWFIAFYKSVSLEKSSGFTWFFSIEFTSSLFLRTFESFRQLLRSHKLNFWNFMRTKTVWARIILGNSFYFLCHWLLEYANIINTMGISGFDALMTVLIAYTIKNFVKMWK